MPEFSDDVCPCEQCQRTQDIYDYLAPQRELIENLRTMNTLIARKLFLEMPDA